MEPEFLLFFQEEPAQGYGFIKESFPKQFLNLTDEETLHYCVVTYKRIEDLENLSKPIIICNEEHRFIVVSNEKDKTDPGAIILEPSRRNTAPAITIAALKAIQDNLEKDIDPTLLILSSDHYIEKVDEFKKSIKQSIKIAKNGGLVIFGIMPTYPSTGYGYIKAENNTK